MGVRKPGLEGWKGAQRLEGLTGKRTLSAWREQGDQDAEPEQGASLSTA